VGAGHVNITRIDVGGTIYCWVHWVGVSGREKMYSGSSIIIIIYPTLSLAIGG
jgi:hypothetical protein